MALGKIFNPIPRPVGQGETGDISIFPGNPSAADPLQPHDCAHQGGFPNAVAPQHRHHLARRAASDTPRRQSDAR